MSIQKFKKKSGSFHTEHGVTIWRENLDIYGNSYKDYNVLELEGFERECTFKLVFVKEINDIDSFAKIKKFFAQSVHVKIRDDVTPNIVLRKEKTTWFLSDISYLGNTMIVPLFSDETVIVEKSPPYPVTQLEAQAIMKESAFAFGKVEQNSDGSLEYYVTV
jgi:hypothetical protein